MHYTRVKTFKTIDSIKPRAVLQKNILALPVFERNQGFYVFLNLPSFTCAKYGLILYYLKRTKGNKTSSKVLLYSLAPGPYAACIHKIL